jgi:hypothetical protein
VVVEIIFQKLGKSVVEGLPLRSINFSGGLAPGCSFSGPWAKKRTEISKKQKETENEQTSFHNQTCECGYRATQLVRCGRY